MPAGQQPQSKPPIPPFSSEQPPIKPPTHAARIVASSPRISQTLRPLRLDLSLTIAPTVALHAESRSLSRAHRHRAMSVAASSVAAAASSAVVAAEVSLALHKVRESIAAACASHGVTRTPLLVAVSKTKPAEAVSYAYAGGARSFGENYVSELVDKSTHRLLSPRLTPGLRWHFIGHLQSNKCRALCKVPGLAMVESVDSAKLATELNKAWAAMVKAEGTTAPSASASSTAAAASSSASSAAAGSASGSSAAGSAPAAPTRPARLPILIQVNSSGESSKFGCAPSEVLGLFSHVIESCPALEARGMMTIGSPLATDAARARECFKLMRQLKMQVLERFGKKEGEGAGAGAGAAGSGEAGSVAAAPGAVSSSASALTVDASSFELSMGMSGDFADAIAEGSTEVRVGSSIFGAREYAASKPTAPTAATAEALSEETKEGAQAATGKQ